MDLQQGRGPEDEADGAERAFEALREEVAALRRGIELVYRQVQQAPVVPEAPDYSPTLGRMAQGLQAIAGRLAAVERKPAMTMTAESYRTDIESVAQGAASVIGRPFVENLQQARAATRDLEALAGRVRERRERQQWLAVAAAVGVMGGLFLWFMLVVLLPWGAGDWLASLPLGGGEWRAGQSLMQEADPTSWERMVRLYRACPQDSTTELCEAAMAVRTIRREREGAKNVPPSITSSQSLRRGK